MYFLESKKAILRVLFELSSNGHSTATGSQIENGQHTGAFRYTPSGARVVSTVPGTS